MKRRRVKLRLSRETLRSVDFDQVRPLVGGAPTMDCTFFCTYQVVTGCGCTNYTYIGNPTLCEPC